MGKGFRPKTALFAPDYTPEPAILQQKGLKPIQFVSVPLFDYQSLLQSVEPESQLYELSQSLSESDVELYSDCAKSGTS